MAVEGHFLNGTTSGRVIARLEVMSNLSKYVRLHIQDNQPKDIDITEVKVSSRLGNTPRELVFADGSLFVTHDNDGIDATLRQLNSSKSVSLIHRLESNLPLIFISIVITFFFIWSTAKFGIPAASKHIAHNMPEFVSDQFGTELTLLDETFFDPSELDSETQKRVQELVKPYLQQHQSLNPELHFRSGVGANAFALPGGDIILTDDFIVLTETDEELLAVVFHELGHLQQKHMARRVIQDLMVTLVVLFVVGDVSSLDILTGIPTLMLDLSYSRGFETEADEFALQQLHQNGLPVDAFASIMLGLQNQHSHTETNKKTEKAAIEEGEQTDGNDDLSNWHLPKYLSTHPYVDERIKLVEEFKLKHNL